MSDPIITRHLSPYVSEQGPASELNRDRAQLAALGASNIEKINNAPAGDLISREAEFECTPIGALSDAQAEIACLKAEVERLTEGEARLSRQLNESALIWQGMVAAARADALEEAALAVSAGDTVTRIQAKIRALKERR